MNWQLLHRMSLKELWKELDKRLQGRGVMEIDLHNLEREWAEQPERHLIICAIAAVCSREVDHAKAEFEVAKAQSAKSIRKTPAKYLVDGKVTEPSVKEAIVLHPTYKEAMDKLIEAEAMKATADGMRSASDHRKKALENEVSLWSQSYFGKPKTERLKHEKSKKVLD